MEQQNEKIELNFLELFLYLKKKLIIIIATALLFGLGGYLYCTFFVPPQYVADTRIYVLRRSGESGVNTSDFQTSSYMLKDYQVLLTGRNVTQEVIDRLNLNMSTSALAGRIEISAPSSTRVLQIRVSDTNPQRAADIANTVRDVATEQIQNVMEVDNVHLVYEAIPPQSPSSTKAVYKASICALVGLVLMMVAWITVFVLDDTIRNEEDVAHYLGLSVIGVIPASSDMLVARDDAEDKKRKYIPDKKRVVRK